MSGGITQGGEPLQGLRKSLTGKDRRALCWDRQMRPAERAVLCRAAGLSAELTDGYTNTEWAKIPPAVRKEILEAAYRAATWARGLALHGPWGGWGPLGGEPLTDMDTNARIVAIVRQVAERLPESDALGNEARALMGILTGDLMRVA